MKKYLTLILLPAVLLISCNDDDGYSLDKFWVSIATVENPDNDPFFYLQLDDENKLKIAATNYYNYRPGTGQRIIANYTILNDKPSGSFYQHDVKLNDAYNILTKDIFNITPETQDSIGNDAIGIKDMWIGNNYLNIQFYYGGYNKIHFINLIKDDSKDYNDNKTHLEFRHNAYNDEERYRHSGIVSFNLNSLFVQSQDLTRVNLVIHVKEIGGNEKTYEFTFHPGNTEKVLQELDSDDYDEGKGGDFE